MQDLHLWRLLHQDDIRAEAVVPLLGQLASVPEAERLAFFGPLARLLEHGDAAVRAAAVAVLAGTNGVPAYRQMVALLNDPEAVVRGAALEALRISAGSEPNRWAHALFHPLAEVRRAAVDPGRPFPLSGWLPLYLLPDPACAEHVLARLGEQSLPPVLLPLLLDYAGRGLLSRAQARRFIAAIPWAGCSRQLGAGPSRPPAEVDRVLAAALAAATAETAVGSWGHDLLDKVFDLFFDAEAAAEGSAALAAPATRFFHGLGKHLHGQPPEARLPQVAALLLTGARRGKWPTAAAELCAVFWPDFLRCAWVPRDVRYQAVRGLYAFAQRCPRLADGQVRDLVLSPLCRRPSGELDLWVVGGILHLASKEPYKLLCSCIKLAEILGAFWQDMEYALPFLCLTDNSEWGSRYLITRLLRGRAAGGALLPALLTFASPADHLDFLVSATPGDAVSIFLELRRLGLYRGLALPPAKKQKAAELLGDRIADGALAAFLQSWLALPAPEETELGLLVLGRAARQVGSSQIVLTALALAPPLLHKLLHVIAWCAGFPYEKETELARALAGHGDPEVRAWAADRLPAGSAAEASAPAARPKKARKLKRELAEAIATCAEADLPAALVPCLSEPMLGLCAALARRSTPLSARVDVCTALLGCHDPVPQVAEQLTRFGAADATFVERLEKLMVRTWRGNPALPLAGHAWLHRWEEHCYAFAGHLGELPAGLVSVLEMARGLPAPALWRRFWEAAARLVALWRWHNKPRFAEVCCPAVTSFLVAELSGPDGRLAAQMLVTFHESGTASAHMDEVRRQVLARLPDLPDPVRAVLRWWIDASGLPPAPAAAAVVERSEDVLAQIRACDDLRQLTAWCAGGDLRLAEEAALRLAELGEAGAERLAGLLRRAPAPPACRSLAATVALWPDGAARRSMAALVKDETAWPPTRFLVGLELLGQGADDLLPAILSAAGQPAEPPWFVPDDWQRLLRAGAAELDMALSLAGSPQPHAYGLAIRYLTAPSTAFSPPVRQALTAFLEAGTERWAELRIMAALALHRHNDYAGFPILLRHVLSSADVFPPLLEAAPAWLIDETLTAVLTAGPRLADEYRLELLLGAIRAAPQAQDEAYSRLLAEAISAQVRIKVVSRLGGSRSRALKVRRVAEAFAWGIRRGRELTGRLFTVQMIAGQGLGYTRFEENRLYITPLPILRSERHGRAIVEGLLLHELGHHIYHRGPEKQAVWDEATRQGLHSLVNLVADEHLERNLRGLDEDFGDRLKKLTAYAFQHSVREVALGPLLNCLQARSFEVLTGVRLGVARKPDCVLIEGGRALLEMEKAGLSFARFVRALRMGLGNRHHDPRVAEGLALFRRNFRASSMPELVAIARRLREIFGWETDILQSFAQDELLRGDDGDLLCHGEGLSDEEVQSEIQRVLNPGPRQQGQAAGGAPGPRWINVNPNEQFQPITTVVPVPHDPAAHAGYAARVARHARRMRRYLEELGLASAPQRRRTQGHTLDRTRLRAAVLHGDPRVLIARQLQIKTDLFVGVLIDCSGSMQSAGNIEKAKLFGTLLAEAARGYRGIDLRLFGFTDKVIYDAGSAARCAVHALHADGGNNDAAALWHAAQLARASRRQARLLVMISDGLPTECSAAALRALVNRLTRRLGMCCAQVAVQPLAEVCFPNYILLQENDLDASVRRFGQVVARLVRKAMQG
jgi:hypothetical protein